MNTNPYAQGSQMMTTPDGYSYQVPTLSQADMGPNPWGSISASDQQAQTQGTQQAQQNISQFQGMMGGDASQYPAMQNAYGLGASIQPTPGTASNPNYLNQPINVTMPDSSSRGFNPWSLEGESNARGR